MHVIDITQRTPDWHAWRNAGVSASDAAAVLGVSRATVYALRKESQGRQYAPSRTRAAG